MHLEMQSPAKSGTLQGDHEQFAARLTTLVLPSTARYESTMLVLVFVMILGVFLDVWSHGQHLTERFFSIWHAPFYTAYLATACWVLAPAFRARRVQVASAGLSPAWRYDVAGVAIFGLGGVSDAVWHSLWGLETGVDVLFSPSHFLLFLGLMLMASSPFRAAWMERDSPGAAVSLRTLLLPLLSLALTTSLVAVVLIHLWGFTSSLYMTRSTMLQIQEITQVPLTERLLREMAYARWVANILITNAVLMVPVLLLLRRWRVPFGGITFLFTLPVALMAAVTGFFYVPRLLAVPIVAGLAADCLVWRLRVSPWNVAALRVFSVATPVILWSLYIAAVHLEWGMARPPLIWSGLVLWTGMEGLALSLLTGQPGVGARAAW